MGLDMSFDSVPIHIINSGVFRYSYYESNKYFSNDEILHLITYVY